MSFSPELCLPSSSFCVTSHLSQVYLEITTVPWTHDKKDKERALGISKYAHSQLLCSTGTCLWTLSHDTQSNNFFPINLTWSGFILFCIRNFHVLITSWTCQPLQVGESCKAEIYLPSSLQHLGKTLPCFPTMRSQGLVWQSGSYPSTPTSDLKFSKHFSLGWFRGLEYVVYLHTLCDKIVYTWDLMGQSFIPGLWIHSLV